MVCLRGADLCRIGERPQVIAHPLRPRLADVELRADRPDRGNPVSRDVLGEQFRYLLLQRVCLALVIVSGQPWFWMDGTGERVHLTGVSPPSFEVARVGPVYTPPGERGRGWTSNAVAGVSRQVQAAGARVCLFTDQANPTSNKTYAALGYQPVVDMANLVVVR